MKLSTRKSIQFINKCIILKINKLPEANCLQDCKVLNQTQLTLIWHDLGVLINNLGPEIKMVMKNLSKYSLTF